MTMGQRPGTAVLPSALGRVRSPRRIVPSLIRMARSLVVTLLAYCSGLGCQALAADAGATPPSMVNPNALTSAAHSRRIIRTPATQTTRTDERYRLKPPKLRQ